MDARARALEEEETALARQMEEIRQQMESLKNPPPVPASTPVWRADPEAKSGTSPVPHAPSPKRPTRIHRAQQKRDRNLFILLTVLVLLVLLLLFHALK